MTFYFPRSLPCSVCRVDPFRHTGWFLVAENRWLDRIKVLQWHPQLASQKEIKSVCGRVHLKILIENWTSAASLRIPVHTFPPLPIGSDPQLADPDIGASCAGLVLGELAIHRETGSRVWSGSQEALDHILEMMVGGAEARIREEGLWRNLGKGKSTEQIKSAIVPPMRVSWHGLSPQ